MNNEARFRLDTEALSEYLQSVIHGFHGPVAATKFDNGQSNPTYKLEASSGVYVLRRKPPGTLLTSLWNTEMGECCGTLRYLILHCHSAQRILM